MQHKSVMLMEVIEALNLKEESVVVDATLGYAGHSSEILKRIPKGHLYAFDQDDEAIRSSQDRLQKIGNHFTVIKSNFKDMGPALLERGVRKVDGILFDLGVSSPQLDDAKRGFSFHKEAPLDMRMDRTVPFSAYDVVNTYSVEQLTDIFFRFGEDKFARSIAKNIVRHREKVPIKTTLELVDIIKEAVPEKAKRDKHPGRQIFQAIRIEVNHELDILEGSLKEAAALLSVGGRLAVITFHSLEDRITKQVFRHLSEEDPLLKGMPGVSEELLPSYRIVTRKATEASLAEQEENPRSRSAKLRVLERIR